MSPVTVSPVTFSGNSWIASSRAADEWSETAVVDKSGLIFFGWKQPVRIWLAASTLTAVYDDSQRAEQSRKQVCFSSSFYVTWFCLHGSLLEGSSVHFLQIIDHNIPAAQVIYSMAIFSSQEKLLNCVFWVACRWLSNTINYPVVKCLPQMDTRWLTGSPFTISILSVDSSKLSPVFQSGTSTCFHPERWAWLFWGQESGSRPALGHTGMTGLVQVQK